MEGSYTFVMTTMQQDWTIKISDGKVLHCPMTKNGHFIEGPPPHITTDQVLQVAKVYERRRCS